MTAWTFPGIDPQALPAWYSLTARIDDLVDEGRPPPCVVDPDPFTSELWLDRREAAAACLGCPLRRPCAKFADANAETWGAWGGRDRARRRASRKAGRAA